MIRKMLFLFLFCQPLLIFSQGFGVTSTYMVIVKSTGSSTPPHEYTQFINNSGHDINMRWKVDYAHTTIQSGWQIAIQDNTTYHNPAPDSADFVLPDTVGAMDKIIINVYHNGIPGYGHYSMDLINLDSTDQVINIVFDITINAVASVSETTVTSFLMYPNPAVDLISFKVEGLSPEQWSGVITDLSGRVVLNNISVQGTVNVQALEKGFYIFTLVDSLGAPIHRCMFSKL